MFLDALLKAVKEVLANPPISRCADHGDSCPFCYVKINYWPNSHTQHKPDCFLIQVVVSLQAPLKIWVCMGWDGDTWSDENYCLSIEAAFAYWLPEQRSITFQIVKGDDEYYEVFHDEVKIGCIMTEEISLS